VRMYSAVAMALAASAPLLGLSPAAPAQTWVETHPVPVDAGSRVRSPDMPAETKPAPFREARADDEPKPGNGAQADKGPLDHPANAGGESNRHE